MSVPDVDKQPQIRLNKHFPESVAPGDYLRSSAFIGG